MWQEAIKILEEKADKNLFDLSRSNFLLNMAPEARETKAKMNYWDLIKIKSFCKAKETNSKTKRQPTEWEKVFANDISDKGLVSKIYKELIKLNTQKTIQWRNGQKTWIETSPKKTSRWPTDTWKNCSTSLIIREIQIKTTMRYHLTPVRMAHINNSGEDVEKEDLFCIAGGNASWCSHSGKQYGGSSKN